jgi:hypothetical protein
MKALRGAILLVGIWGTQFGTALGQDSRVASLCVLQRDPESFLHSKVEVDAVIFVGMEIGQLLDGKCSFRFAFGDDHQTFGDKFHVDHDATWDRMMSLLKTPNKCAGGARVVKAHVRGVVERVPKTVGVPENEMPFELVITGVLTVQSPRAGCTTIDTLPHESGHADPPKPQ